MDRKKNIILKAEEGNGLELEETIFLFENIRDIDEALRIATQLNNKGDLATLYTCLYITNSCVNACGYCGYRKSNDGLERITLTPEQILEEAEVIKEQGITNVILIGGTNPEEDYRDLIVSGTRSLLELGLVPCIEFENLSRETLRELTEEGARHFVLFQETYDRELYMALHGNNPLKNDYDARLQEVDKAIDAGFTNINIGALFGLSKDYTSEIIGLYDHAKRLQEKGVKVCISIPTLKPAPGISISSVPEDVIMKAYVVLRLALPDVSLALSGRESEELRNRLFPVVDQIGTRGVPNPGGRTVYREKYEQGDTQFKLYDTRSPQEIVSVLGIRTNSIRGTVK